VLGLPLLGQPLDRAGRLAVGSAMSRCEQSDDAVGQSARVQGSGGYVR